MIKVSVVVPVYNPGHDIDDCIRSLLGQSLPDDAYEVIFVDDGSTDDTPARLDALAAEHPNVRVEHIPNSGWPSRPRNLGIDLARGEFVYFVDNDDWLAPEALERMVERAESAGADVVLGKVVGHGASKHVPHVVFRKDRPRVSLEQWTGLLWLLTPHKLFRRSLLNEHGIRFPEGKVRLEDHDVCLRAYFAAGDRISVLADYPCYHWMLRDDVSNASMRTFDSKTYYDSVRRVLDVIDEHTEPGPFRDRLYVRWYRGKILGRVGGHPILRYVGDQRRMRYEEARGVALERFGEHLDALLPPAYRQRAQLLRAGDFDGLVALAERETAMKVTARIAGIRHDGSDVTFSFTAAYRPKDDLLRLRRDGDALVWTETGEDVAAELDEAEAYVFARSLADRSEWPVPVEARLELVEVPDADGLLRPVLRGTGRLPAGSLPDGDVRLGVEVRMLGFRVLGLLRPSARAEAATFHVAKGRVTLGRPTLARRVAAAFPGLARVAVRTRRRTRVLLKR